MSMKVTNASTYFISIGQVDGLFMGAQSIYLRDNQSGAVHDIKQNPYTFVSEAGTFNIRFNLIYQNALNIKEPVFDAKQLVVISNNDLLTVHSGSVLMTAMKVLDIRGRLMESKNSIHTNQITIESGSVNQVLLVQVTSADGITVTKKVVK